MTHLFKKAVLGAALVASASLAAAPVEARDRYDRHHDRTGTAIAAGVVGLAIGAALASGNRDRHYDRGYNGDEYYYPQQSYNNYNGYPRGYNYDGYRYDNYDRRYRDGYRYERKHRKWHRKHGRWDD